MGTKTFTWEVDGVSEDDVIAVNCSDELNKTNNDFGVECLIEVTDDTNLVDNQGNEITINDIQEGSNIKVTLTSSIEIKTKDNYKAEEIVLYNN
ncbi:hypothetical protein [Aquisalibacillus elongatus]|nr:hypothetical protein [Aquisalibacillus elongatus]